MPGLIRVITGLIICMAAVESNENVSLLMIAFLGVLGLSILYSGVLAMKDQNNV